MLAKANTVIAGEAMPDADPERSRRQALPRIAINASVYGWESARSEEMPDPFGAGTAGR
jgi:hypothetical protein